MTLIALGLAAELRDAGVASNALWPRTLIATAAVRNLLGGEAALAMARSPEVYAGAAYLILTSPSRECTGNTFLCEDVLISHGVTDLDKYSTTPGQTKFGVDLYVDDAYPPATGHRPAPGRPLAGAPTARPQRRLSAPYDSRTSLRSR